MSIPDRDEPPEPEPSSARAAEPTREQAIPGATGLIVRLVVPIAVALVFAAVAIGDLLAARSDRDLQLLSPPEAAPGQRIGLRALVLTQTRSDRAPTLETAPVRVRLVDGDDTLARATLEPATAGGMEGDLEVPPGASGELTLRARAELDDGPSDAAEASLRVRSEPRPAQTEPRLANALQHLAAFPVRDVGGAEPPAELSPRFLGGACVPETRCDVVVHVGEPAAAVQVERTASVEPLDDEPSDPTAGLARRRIRVHGAEGDMRLVALRDGEPVARRGIRVPVALAVPALHLEGSPIDAARRPRVSVEGLGAEDGVLVDAYAGGVWSRAASLPAGSAPHEVPVRGLEPGVWRLQAWSSLLSDAPMPRLLLVREPGMDDQAALRRIARHSVEQGWNDAHAGAVLDGRASSPPALQAAYMLALGETEHVPRVRGVSAAAQASRAGRERSTSLRAFAALSIVAFGLAVAFVLLRRGLRASAEARDLLLLAGDADATDVRRKRRATLSVVGIVAFVLIVFLAAGLFLLVRQGWAV